MKIHAKILIVEDNPLNMELAADLLADAGYEVLQAATAEKGIQLARSLLPDLILMDTSLPGMDGLQATMILKDDSETRHIPVVRSRTSPNRSIPGRLSKAFRHS
jgi:two-component system cell cycle response regulator DivK